MSLTTLVSVSSVVAELSVIGGSSGSVVAGLSVVSVAAIVVAEFVDGAVSSPELLQAATARATRASADHLTFIR
jgi:hypothetical protein